MPLRTIHIKRALDTHGGSWVLLVTFGFSYGLRLTSPLSIVGGVGVNLDAWLGVCLFELRSATALRSLRVTVTAQV
jgi:hypothetical protein